MPNFDIEEVEEDDRVKEMVEKIRAKIRGREAIPEEVKNFKPPFIPYMMVHDGVVWIHNRDGSIVRQDNFPPPIINPPRVPVPEQRLVRDNEDNLYYLDKIFGFPYLHQGIDGRWWATHIDGRIVRMRYFDEFPPDIPKREPALKFFGEPILKKKTDMPKDYKVRELVGSAVKGTFGIEVELEGKNLPPDWGWDSCWSIKRDGSLRNGGLEYVLTSPLDLKEAKESIHTLKHDLNRVGSELSFSFRTSVHVHVNVLDMNKEQLVAFLYLSHIMEDALVEFSGDARKGNRFCLRTKDAEQKIDALKILITDKYIHGFDENRVKYSAINLATITRYGSVEFRSMRGTLDEGTLNTWLDVLNNIRELSLVKSVKEIAAETIADPVGFAKKVLGEHFKMFNYPTLEQDIRASYCRLIEIPYLKIG